MRKKWDSKSIYILGILIVALILAAFKAQAEETSVLSLDLYRMQVENKDPQYKSAKLAVEGSRLADNSSESITDLQVIANAYYNDDRRPTNNPSFQGSRTLTETANVGIQKQFLYGPTLELTQNFSHVQIFDASTTSIPLADYYDSYPKIGLSVPLWKNFMGWKTQAQQEVMKAQSKSQVLKSDLDFIQSNARIEMAYYNLAAAQENFAIQKDMLDRAEKIRSWVSGQYKRGLIDIADSHQAQAAVTLRQIELQRAENTLKSTAREFNALRGLDSTEVTEALQPKDLSLQELKVAAAEIKSRKDLALEMAGLETSKANSQSQLEDSKPKLDLNVQAQWNGRDEKYSEAYDESFKEDQTLWYVGLQFQMPLDQLKYSDAREGNRKLLKSYGYKQEALKRDTKKAWKEFIDQGALLHDQVKLVRELEDVQKKKADAERRRLQRGRSTTFQVLTYEQDYITAKSQRINTELKAREFLTQLPMFE